MTLALEHLKVLDLSRYPPGMFSTMILADLGADVLHIEPPESAGGRRAFRSGPQGEEAQRAAAYDALRRNKRHLLLNLRTQEAREVFYKLAAGVDVVMEGFRPGVVKRLGVDYDTLKDLNPRLIYCSLTGYGQDGPYQALPGHDLNYTAMGGILGMIGPKGGPPIIPYNFMADYAGGALHAVISILTAVIAREQTGKGQFLDVAMMDGVVHISAFNLGEHFRQGTVPRPGEMPLNGGSPQYNVYETSDGKYLAIGCLEAWFWENLCRSLGREEFIPHLSDPDWSEEMRRGLQETFRTRSRDEWFESLSKEDVCVSKVYSLDELAERTPRCRPGTWW